MKIDWSRVARPQADSYDLLVIEHLSQLPPSDIETDVTICDGLVNVAALPPSVGGVSQASPEMVDLWTMQIDAYLDKWTAGYKSIQNFLDTFHPLSWGPQPGRGCTSGHIWDTRGIPKTNAIYVTINDLQGCAQGIYHEVAHLRLHRLGIHMEDHDFTLLTNDPSELYNSSVRFDKKRPMTAVLHGVYAWLMFTTNDIALWRHNGDGELFKTYAERNIPKIQNGMSELAQYARWTTEGTAFFESLVGWSDALVSEANFIMGSSHGHR